MTQALLKEALSHYGLAETPGPASNPKIVAMSKALGYPFKSEDDSWCGIFLAYCTHRVGLPRPERAYSARTWLQAGFAVTVPPETGDIAVLWRGEPAGWQGHVGIFVSYADEGKRQLNLLGGNQSDRVSISPYEASHVLGFRRLG